MSMAQTNGGQPQGFDISNGPDFASQYQKRDTSPMQNPATNTMPAFDRLLVATDFSVASQAAFRAALDTCTALGASLVLLHVCEYPPAGPETGGFLIEQQVLCEQCRNGLEELRQQADRAGVTSETILTHGVAASSILETIAVKQIDLVVLGTNALHGFERLVFGSTAEAVLRKSPCPVLTVGPRVGQGAKVPAKSDGPIIFATDFDFSTIHAIRYAACFSNLNGAPLHCLHVLPRTLEAGTQCEIVPSIMSEALQQVAAESGVVIDPPTCATTFGSEISYAVVDYAREQRARLIVLGVRQASLLASHVPEHITYRIITEANCPVLTMAFSSDPHAMRLADHH
jgi:nucleotide-binding universal stress UspA family protein